MYLQYRLGRHVLYSLSSLLFHLCLAYCGPILLLFAMVVFLARLLSLMAVGYPRPNCQKVSGPCYVEVIEFGS